MSVTLAGVLWWPHSGGRWLCRSIIKPHSQVHETAFTHPWIFFTSDMTLDLDITAQVHKARSMPDLKGHLAALQQSTDHGRVQGLKYYFDYIRETYPTEHPDAKVILGEMCMGSPIPREADLDALFKACPDFKLIHLVRSPAESYLSFANRHEMDSNPAKVAGSWIMLNSMVRTYMEKHPELKDQFLLVRYEELMQEPHRLAAEVATFLGLEFEESMVATLGERWGRNTSSKVPEAIQQTILEIASGELSKFGYALDTAE